MEPITKSSEIFSNIPNKINSQLLIQNPNIKPILCAICKNIPNPYRCLQHKKCEQLFCKDCAMNMNWDKGTCSHCNSVIDDIETEMILIREQCIPIFDQIKNYQIHCLNYNSNNDTCKWIGNIMALGEHLKSCSLKVELCKWCCGREFTKDKIIAHENNECALRIVLCELCGKQFPYKKLNSHKMNDCEKNPDKPKECKFEEMGCVFGGTNSELEEHYKGQGQMHLDLCVKYAEELRKTIAENNEIIKKQKLDKEEVKHAKNIDRYKESSRKFPQSARRFMSKPQEFVKLPESKYFRVCKNKHPLNLDRSFNKCECTACANIINKNEQQWVCSICDFHICEKCSAISYEQDREPYLYTFCPICIDTPKPLVKRVRNFKNAEFHNCGCILFLMGIFNKI